MKLYFQWCRLGDKNTRLCHLTATARQRRNVILSLKVGGNLISDPAFIRRKLWFSSKSSIPKRIYSDLLARIWSSISCSHPFPPIWKVHFPWKKLKLLFFYCDGNKTPWPDGMIFLFWRKLGRGLSQLRLLA